MPSICQYNTKFGASECPIELRSNVPRPPALFGAGDTHNHYHSCCMSRSRKASKIGLVVHHSFCMRCPILMYEADVPFLSCQVSHTIFSITRLYVVQTSVKVSIPLADVVGVEFCAESRNPFDKEAGDGRQSRLTCTFRRRQSVLYVPRLTTVITMKHGGSPQ